MSRFGLPMKRLLIQVMMAALVAVSAMGQESGAGAGSQTMGRPGYLIISSGRDSTAGFRWLAGPGVAQKSLVWESGQLILPDSMSLESFGADDLGISTTEDLQGSSGGGVLSFRDGRFAVDQPLLLTDGVISLYTADGELEIRGAQVRYVPPNVDKANDSRLPDPRAGFLFLAGIVLLIVVLMRRARLRSGKLK